MILRKLTIAVISIFVCQSLMAQTTSTQSGDWDDPTTWVGGTVPTSGAVVIATGHTVTYNADHANVTNTLTISTLDIQGTGVLQWPFSDDAKYDANFTLNCTGAVTIAASAAMNNLEGDLGVSLDGNPADRTHQIEFRNGLSNAGTLDLTGTTTARIINADLDNNTQSVSGAGAFTFYAIDVRGTGATVTFQSTTITVDSDIDLQQDATLVVDGGTLNVGPDVFRPLDFQGAGNTFRVINSAVVNIRASATVTNSDAVRVNADNCTFDVQSGTVTIGNPTGTGEGRFRINAAAATDFSFDISGGTVTIGEFISQAAGSVVDYNVTGGTLNVSTGDQGGEANTTIQTGSTFTVDGATTAVNFGENAVFNVVPTISNGATFSVGTNASQAANFNMVGVWTLDGASTINADAGLTIATGNSLTVQGSSILNVESNNTSISAVELSLGGTLTLNTGTINIAGSVVDAGTITQDIIRITEGGDLNIQDGTVNIANNAGLTDGSIYAAQALQIIGTTDGNLTIGNGVGSANTAALNISTNIASQGVPTNENLLVNNTDDGQILVNTDGLFNLGGGNIGSLLLDDDDGSTDADFHLVVQGGTVNIAGDLRLDEGAGYQQTGGTVNVGIAASSGLNNLLFGTADPTSPSIFEITGGTFNVGDGSINISIGDNDASPAFGTVDMYHEMEITGGTVNINGRLQLEDQNARLILGGNATINLNPRGFNDLNEDLDILWLRNGIVDIQGAVNVNFLNPHASTGIGFAIEMDPEGTGNNAITSSTLGSAPVDFSNVTWGFGDGVESENGVDGFDLDFAAGHTSYGNFVINNPSGTGREVTITNAGNSYLTEDITITAGVFDVGTNNLDDDGAGSTFLIDANGTLRLDTDFPGTSTTVYTTYTLNTGSTVEYNGTAAVANAQVPDLTAFHNLIVSGAAIKTINGATSANGTVTLTAGTLAAGTNLTLGAGSTISRSAGVITGTIQGTNAYTVEYTGLDKTINDTSDPEWSGAGTKSLIVNADVGQTITFTTSELDLTDLTISQGTMTDDNAGFNHDVSGNLTLDGPFTGLGAINITGGTATHTLSTSGTATVSNLTMNDASFDASGDLDLTITNGLTLTAGDIQLTSGTFTLSSGATITGGSSTSYVAFDGTNSAGGMKQTFQSATDSRTYPIGSTTEYTPGTVTLTAASGFGELTIVPVASGSPFTLDGSNTIDLNYHWILTTDGTFSGITVNHSFGYDETDVQGVEGSYVSARYNVAMPEWTDSDETADGSDGVNPTTNTLTLTGVDFIDGHITAGELDEFSGVITTFYLRSDLVEPLDWNDGTNWTNTDGGTSPINRVPGTNSPVVIKRIVNVDADSQSAGSINIDAAGTMIIGENGTSTPSSGHSFGTVSGTGLLRIISDDTDNPTFPDENGGNWSAFLGASGGTVEYSGDGSYTLPSDVSGYNNLTVTSTNAACSCTKTFGDVDVTITGDLNISGANTTVAAISDATNGNLTITGDITVAATNTLQFGATNARTISATNVTNSGTLDVVNSGSAAHSLSIGGTLSSGGTTDFNTGGSTVDVTFTGTGNETIAGAGSVDFNRVTVNKGTSQAPTLEATVTTMTITDTGGGASSSIDLQNGTLILSTGGTFTVRTSGDFTIPSTSKLDLNSGSPTVQMTSSSAGTFFLNGSLEISSGIVNVGDQTDLATDNSIRYDGTTAEIIVNGGILNIGGAIRPNVLDESAALDFTLSSGTVSLARNTSTTNIAMTNAANRSEGDFVLNNASSSFTMSGGTFEVIRAEVGDGKAMAISNAVTDYTVTGGTVNLVRDAHDAFSSNSTNQAVDLAISSNAPLWNLQIGDGDFTGDVGNANINGANDLDLVILNDFTLNINNTTAGQGNFDMFQVNQASTANLDEMDMFVGGSFTITDGSFNVVDDGTDGTVTFNGSGLTGQTSPQVITTGGESIGDVVINNTSGSVDLADNLTIDGDWTYTAGTFNQATFSVTLDNATGIGTSINGSSSFDDLILSNTNDITLSGGDLTINSGGSLTVSDDVIFDIGDNGVIVNETTAGGITFSATPDATNMVRASGTTSAKGITRAYPNSTTTGFVFQLGTNVSATDYYTPAQIDLTVAGGAGGTITVVPVSSQHPLTESTSTALDYYWRVSDNGGFNGSQEATHTYTYGTEALVEGAGDDAGFVGSYNVGSPTFNWDNTNPNQSVDEVDLSGPEGVITFTAPGGGPTGNVISGDFTAGLLAAFPAVTVFYTLRTGNWNDVGAGTTPWTNDACGGAQTEVLLAPTASDPVVICSGNTVTITTAVGLAASGTSIEGVIASDIDDISAIGDIDGTGSLEFDHTTAVTPVFGTLSGTFIGASGGTVDYGGTETYTLPAIATYNNLILSNSDSIIFPSSISINGDATFNGNVIEQAGFTLSDADGGGTFSLGSSAILLVDAANNFPTNFNTYTLNATSTVNYILNNVAQTVQGGITYGNLTLTRITNGNPVAKQLNGNITIQGNLDIGRRTELQAGTHTITLQGNWSMNTLNATNFDPGTGTVIFAGNSNQTVTFTPGVENETFYNLEINQSGTGTNVSFVNVDSVFVSNNLTVTDEALAMGSVPLQVTGTTSTAANGTLSSNIDLDLNGDLTNAGTLAVPDTINLNGNFTNTGTYNNTSNVLLFDNTSSAQSIGGNATTFNNISVQKATGVDLTINANTTVNGTIALVNEGNVVMGTGDLIIGSAGSITGNGGGSASTDFSNARMIRNAGGGSDPRIIKAAGSTSDDWDFVFPIGVDDGGNVYTPVTVGATGGTVSSGELRIRSVNGTTTDESISGSATTLNRFFNLETTGISADVTFDILFNYDDGDVQGTEADYNAAYSELSVGDGWNRPVVSVDNVDPATNVFGASASLDGTINLGNISTEWIAGDNDLLFPRYFPIEDGGGTDCGAITCDWNDPTHWTLTAGGTTAAGTTPGADNAVTISAGTTMAMDNNTNDIQSIVIDGTLDIAGTNGHDLGEVTGAGTLQISLGGLDGYVDTGTGSTFFGSGGGTVEYRGDAAYTLPTAITEYQNLTIGGTTQNTHDKTLGVNTLVFGNLTLGTVDLENPTDFSLELRGVFSSGGGNVNMDDGNFIFSNSAVATLSSNITFGVAGSLTLDNVGEKDLGATLNINNLTINSSSGDLDANSNNINVTGNWDNQSSSNRLTNPATTTFNGGGAQQIDGDNSFSITNISTASTAVTVNSGTQTFSGNLTLAASTSLDLSTSTIRLESGSILDVDAGTFTGSSGTVAYGSTTDPETQTDAITIATLQIDKGVSTNTFDNDPATVTFTNLIITSGEYLGPNLNIGGNLAIGVNGAIDANGATLMDINGNFVNAATLDLPTLGIQQLNIEGNFTNTGTFTAPTAGAALILFDGASAQAVNNDLTVTNLQKSTGGDLTLNADVSVSGTLTLTSGDIISSTTNLLTLGTGASIAGPPSASSHINGAMAHTLASAVLTTKDFPLGDGTNYRPISFDLTQTDATSRVYTASLNGGAAASRIFPIGINHVTNIRHYNVTQNPSDGLTAGVVRITYGPDDDVLNTANLRIAKDDGAGNWVNLGGNVTGDANNGTIESTNNFTSFSDFLLGSSQLEESLPVDLISFTGSWENNAVTLRWSTATEINNSHFVIEKSFDGELFKQIATVQGNGNTDRKIDYQHIDILPSSGINFYRLSQIDFDGTINEHGTIAVIGDNITSLLNVGPNPTSDELTLFNGTLQGDLTIYTLRGIELHHQSLELHKTELDMTHFNSGVYQMVLNTEMGRIFLKIVKE